MQIELKLFPYQKRIFYIEKPIIAFISGTGAGKTWIASRWIVIKALKEEGEYLVVSPTLAMLKRTIWKEIRSFLTGSGIPYKENKSDMWIELPNGSKLWGISADKPERMEGVHAKGAVFDEAGQVDDVSAWEILKRRVARHKGQILISSTPYRWNWLKTEVYDRAMNGDPNIELITVASIENPYYPRDRFKEAKRTLPEWKFRMFFLGQFTKPLGLIYPEYETVEPFEIPQNWHKVRGLDFGYNNPTAIIWLAKSPEGVWYAYKEFKKSEVDLDQLYEILKKENIITYADPELKQGLETLKRRGIKIRPAKKDVLAGISYVQGLFKQKRLKIFKSLTLTIAELNSYSWELDANDEPTDKPRKENDHLMDALRYALFSYEPPKGVFAKALGVVRNSAKLTGGF